MLSPLLSTSDAGRKLGKEPCPPVRLLWLFLPILGYKPLGSHEVLGLASGGGGKGGFRPRQSRFPPGNTLYVPAYASGQPPPSARRETLGKQAVTVVNAK